MKKLMKQPRITGWEEIDMFWSKKKKEKSTVVHKQIDPYTYGNVHAAVVVADMLSNQYSEYKRKVSRFWQPFTTIMTDIIESDMPLKTKKALVPIVYHRWKKELSVKKMPQDLRSHIDNMLVAYYRGCIEKLYQGDK